MSPTLRELTQLPARIPETTNWAARESERIVKDVAKVVADGAKGIIDGARGPVDFFVGKATEGVDGIQQFLAYPEIPVPQRFEEQFRMLPFISRSKANQSVLGVTDQTTVDRIYDLLEFVDAKFRAEGIPYIIASGTLLGAHRHGGMIPWDDDADLCVPVEMAAKIEALKPGLEREGYALKECFFGYKISKREFGDKPFVDLFLLRKSNDYASVDAQLRWPKDKFPYSAFADPEETKFGHLSLLGPKAGEARATLTSCYGPSWVDSACKGMSHDGGLRALLGLTGSSVLVKLTDLRPALRSPQ